MRFNMEAWDALPAKQRRAILKEVENRLAIYEKIMKGKNWEYANCNLCQLTDYRRCDICPINPGPPPPFYSRNVPCDVTPYRRKALYDGDRHCAKMRHKELTCALKKNGFEYK